MKTVCRETNVSKSVLYRLLSKHYGCTLSDYVNKKRVEKAEKLMSDTTLSLSEISELAGYKSETYFRMAFKKVRGVSPSKYRKVNTSG